ncbi:MAG: hypothetical protein U9N59_06840 [Campylobacterota bacterium]|nr:hypothetical protein [Campylobacterota bacterium]
MIIDQINHFNDSNNNIAQKFENTHIENQHNNITEPILPLESFKHFDIKDTILSICIFLSITIAVLSLFYNLTYIAIAGYILISILFIYKVNDIEEVLYVYNNSFSYNGILIPFKYIKKIKIKGNGLHLEYDFSELKNKIIDESKLKKVIAFTKNDEIKKFEEIYNKATIVLD